MSDQSETTVDRRGVTEAQAKKIASDVSWWNIGKCVTALIAISFVLKYAYDGDKGHIETIIKQQNLIFIEKLENLSSQNKTLLSKFNGIVLSQALSDVKLESLAISVADNKKKIETLEKSRIKTNSSIGAE